MRCGSVPLLVFSWLHRSEDVLGGNQFKLRLLQLVMEFEVPLATRVSLFPIFAWTLIGSAKSGEGKVFLRFLD